MGSERIDTADLHWLIGLLEGEGCFSVTPARSYKASRYRYPKISLNMTDEDVVARAASLLGCTYCRIAHAKKKYKDSFQLAVIGRSALEWMILLQPFMGARRKQKIGEIIDGFASGYEGQLFTRHRDAAGMLEDCRFRLATEAAGGIA